jgi:DNA-binding MarR family transcriptional regulator
VLRAAGEQGAFAPLVANLEALRDAIPDVQSPDRAPISRNLSQSLLLGLLVLSYLPSDGSYVANADLAEVLDMPSSTTHRYLATLVTVGVVERDPTSRKYRLPPPGEPDMRGRGSHPKSQPAQ